MIVMFMHLKIRQWVRVVYEQIVNKALIVYELFDEGKAQVDYMYMLIDNKGRSFISILYHLFSLYHQSFVFTKAISYDMA